VLIVGIEGSVQKAALNTDMIEEEEGEEEAAEMECWYHLKALASP
jgi:hypothetical protein